MSIALLPGTLQTVTALVAVPPRFCCAHPPPGPPPADQVQAGLEDARSPTDLGLLRTRLRGRSARRSPDSPALGRCPERLCRHRGHPDQTTRQSSHAIASPERSSRPRPPSRSLASQGPSGSAGYGLQRRPVVAGICGGSRAWTVSMISALSMPCRVGITGRRVVPCSS